MDGLDVFWTGQVAERGAPIIYHHHFIGEVASYVKLQENPENIGERAVSQDATDAVVTIQMWSPERRRMLLPSILRYSTQITRGTSRTSISR